MSLFRLRHFRQFRVVVLYKNQMSKLKDDTMFPPFSTILCIQSDLKKPFAEGFNAPVTYL